MFRSLALSISAFVGAGLAVRPALAQSYNIKCPDGVLYSVNHPSKAPCVKMCPGGGWIVKGEGSCKTATPTERPKKKEATGICTDKRREAAAPLITLVGSREIFVNRAIWNAMDYGVRVGFAKWASACTQKGYRVTIRDGRTGKELAKYSNLWGYSVKE